MTLTEFTSYADVRAAVGLEDDELEDSTLALEVYSIGLREELNSISDQLITLYQDSKGKDVRSTQEARLYDLTRLFSTYAVAKQVGATLGMIGPRTISDGKSSMSRFSGTPYKDTLEKIAEQYELYRRRLEAVIDELTASPSEPFSQALFMAVGSGYDPVTGE